jgi:hypothetical protein
MAATAASSQSVAEFTGFQHHHHTPGVEAILADQGYFPSLLLQQAPPQKELKVEVCNFRAEEGSTPTTSYSSPQPAGWKQDSREQEWFLEHNSQGSPGFLSSSMDDAAFPLGEEHAQHQAALQTSSTSGSGHGAGCSSHPRTPVSSSGGSSKGGAFRKFFGESSDSPRSSSSRNGRGQQQEQARQHSDSHLPGVGSSSPLLRPRPRIFLGNKSWSTTSSSSPLRSARGLSASEGHHVTSLSGTWHASPSEAMHRVDKKGKRGNELHSPLMRIFSSRTRPSSSSSCGSSSSDLARQRRCMSAEGPRSSSQWEDDDSISISVDEDLLGSSRRPSPLIRQHAERQLV